MPVNFPELIGAFKQKPFSYRVKIKNEPLVDEWSNWLIQPSETYIEAEKQGPYPFTEIEWIDINPVIIKNNGRLTSVAAKDHSVEIFQLLSTMQIIGSTTDGMIRVMR